jgi:predicted outer membrane repeat protein
MSIRHFGAAASAVALLLLPYRSAIADIACTTSVAGGPVAGVSWTLTGSPYCVTGDVLASLLTIDPGVEVYFAPDTRLDVLTKISIVGSVEKPVLLSGSDPLLGWKGIRFQDTPCGSTISFATIENARTGAITVTGACPPAIDHALFRKNSNAERGGAIYGDNILGDFVIESSEFIENTSSKSGGAIRVSMAADFELLIDDSRFSYNIANPPFAGGNFAGGALSVSQGAVHISRSQFVENDVHSFCGISCTLGNCGSCSSTATGGAIYLAGSGAKSVTSSEIVQNRVRASGYGTIFNSCQSVSTFVYGGGIFVENGASATISNTVMACNRNLGDCARTAAGGGMFVQTGGVADVINDTIARNSDTTGLFVAGTGSVSVGNSIIWQNNAAGTQVGGTPTISYSTVQNGYAGTGNSSFNPAFQGLGCSAGDLRLVLGSPATDTGDPDLADLDMCFPPSSGSELNDQGAYGGPGACDWSTSCSDAIDCDDRNVCTTDSCVADVCQSASVSDCPAVPLGLAQGSAFGSAVAMTSDLLIAGAPGSGSSGRVHVFVRTDDGYMEQTQTSPIPVPLQDAEHPSANLDFGTAVDVDGDTIIVGAPNDLVAIGDKQSSGSASVFTRNGSVWTRQAKLLDASGQCLGLGTDVGISGNMAVVGAPAGNCALVFERANGSWTLAARLNADVGGTRFGKSVDIDGATIVVGAPGGATTSATTCDGDGSTSIFHRSGSGWTLETTIPSPGGPGDGACFGMAVGIDGSTIVAGAPFDDSEATDAGAVYLYVREESGWELDDQLFAFPSRTARAAFGSSVDILSNLLIVGAPGRGAYVFERPDAAIASGAPRFGNKWTDTRSLEPPATFPADLSKFGFSVSITSGSAAAGAPDQKAGSLASAGAVYPDRSIPELAAVCGNGILTGDEDCDDGDAAWQAGQFCNAGCERIACGDPNDSKTIVSGDALYILKTAVSAVDCDLAVCDVNASGAITTGDALAVLRKAVGLAVTLVCP